MKRPKVSVQSEGAWSVLMARAQDGDGAAYRRLLEEVTPYLRGTGRDPARSKTPCRTFS